MRLYEIEENIRRLLDEVEDDLTDEQLAELENLSMSMEDKVDNCCRMIREWECRANAIEVERRRLQAEESRERGKVARLKEYLRLSFIRLGLKRYETRLFKLRRQDSPPSAVCNVDPATLPDELRKVTIEANRTAAIASWRETGVVPDGFTIERGEHLRLA